MPLVCSICSNPDRQKVDQAIVAGESMRDIAGRFDTTAATIHRHKQNCLKSTLEKLERKRERQALTLHDRLDTIWDIAVGTIQEARAAGERQPIAGLMHQAHKNIEIRGLLSGELGQQHPQNSQVNILLSLPRGSEAPQIAKVIDAEPVQQLEPGDEPSE